MTFMGNFFGRKDLGIQYQEEFKKELQIAKIESKDNLLYKNFNLGFDVFNKKKGGRMRDKSISVVTNEQIGKYYSI
jgi:hypothetical protein